MGDRYILSVVCPKCGFINDDVYYAPTCGFITYKCSCGYVVNLEEYSGISYEDASNRLEIETIINTIVTEQGGNDENSKG